MSSRRPATVARDSLSSARRGPAHRPDSKRTLNVPNDPHNPGEVADDSPIVVLRSLEADRGSIFTEAEYREMRETVIEELARGPRPRFSLLITFGVIGLLLLAVTVIGFAIVFQGIIPDCTLGIVGLCALGVWGYLLRSYLRVVREQSSRSLRERLAELEELQVQKLISQAEYDRIYATIHMGREPVRTSMG